MPSPRLHAASGQTLIVSLMILGFLALGFILIGFASISSELQVATVLENKERSVAAATACMEQAMDRLGRNASYAGSETLIVASST
ncbi:MAG: hypothetical protein NUW08_03555, partial [Candidatus Uhrbacteria bacterium]|nr:hypothetical protein [Candidatus Uhrbacteria bacterium]